jgi:CDP-glucose 4,6-dehydratase
MDKMINREFWTGKRVLVTGHTGFKGSWLILWLHSLGAKVTGCSLEPPTEPNLFTEAHVSSYADSVLCDVRDLPSLCSVVSEVRPEVVFHLAAQSLVRASYKDPIGTYLTNVMGTAHLLESVRQCGSVQALVVVTSDKCYENHEQVWSYRETDCLGGHDPYSSSKGCAEIVTSAYRRSFFGTAASGRTAALATARAGNVIGGGDWALDRLVPDCMRALLSGNPVVVRNPAAVRPWQHVLEPLQGYLMLAERLCTDGERVSPAYNFGPCESDIRSVSLVVNCILARWGANALVTPPDVSEHQPHEAGLLTLDSALAHHELGWRPQMDLNQAVQMTVEWYKAYAAGSPMDKVCFHQLESYSQLPGQ